MTATRTDATRVIEVARDTSFTLVRSDNGRRIVATAAITITLPDPGILGNGFKCEVINDSGGSVIIDGRGLTNVTMSDGDVAHIYEVNSKQRVVDGSSTLVGDVFGGGGDTLWDPGVIFGVNFDLVHWWDASRGVTLDPATGNVSSWQSTIGKVGGDGNVATMTGSTAAQAKQPAWANSDEIRFTGASKGLVPKTQSRASYENRWYMLLFRINWANFTGSDSFLLSINGNTDSFGRQHPRLNFKKATKQLEADWYGNDGHFRVAATVPGSDNDWHTLVARRDQVKITISIDGAAEQELACYSRGYLKSGSAPTGFIGNSITTGLAEAVTNMDWGIDTFLQGQGDLTTDEVAKLHGWGMWKRGVQANLDGSSPYLLAAPTMVEADQHVAAPDSYADGYRFPATGGWDDTVFGNALSLTGATRVFHEHFTDITTLSDGYTGTGPQWWVPAHIDTSGAKFLRPSESPSVYSIVGGTNLQIKMQKVGGIGSIYSGHIQTVDTWGNGNLWTVPAGGYNYFEARYAMGMPLPEWPAFWLYSQEQFTDGTASKCEVDIVEAYASGGTSNNQVHLTNHLHGAYRPQPGNMSSPGNTGADGVYARSPSKVITMSRSPFLTTTLFDGVGDGAPGTFHTYGCKIDETWITFYFDGVILSRFPVYKEALAPLFMICSLQSLDSSTWGGDNYLWIDYVDVWTHA